MDFRQPPSSKPRTILQRLNNHFSGLLARLRFSSCKMSARNDYLTPVTSHPEETDVSSSPSTPGPNEDEGDFFPVQKIESPLSSREGSQQPMVMRERPKYPIDSLPAELLILILGKLSSTQDLLNCLLVSRGWARCTVDLLWHRPLFTTWHRLGIIAESIRSLEPYFNYQQLIRRLNLSNLSEDVNDGTLHAFIGCKKIERLTLTGCRNLTDSGIKALVDGNEKLLALDVTGVTALTDDTILTLAKNCHRLQGLNITGCRHITDQSLVPLAHNCRFLKRVRLLCHSKTYVLTRIVETQSLYPRNRCCNRSVCSQVWPNARD